MPGIPLLLAAVLAAPVAALADAVTDWNARDCELVVAAGVGNQPAHRVLAIAHTAALPCNSAAQIE